MTIYGHTDNTGTRAVNERISKERADAVANFLVGQGISRSRLTTEGLAFDQPVADNSTAGRTGTEPESRNIYHGECRHDQES